MVYQARQNLWAVLPFRCGQRYLENDAVAANTKPNQSAGKEERNDSELQTLLPDFRRNDLTRPLFIWLVRTSSTFLRYARQLG